MLNNIIKTSYKTVAGTAVYLLRPFLIIQIYHALVIPILLDVK